MKEINTESNIKSSKDNIFPIIIFFFAIVIIVLGVWYIKNKDNPTEYNEAKKNETNTTAGCEIKNMTKNDITIMQYLNTKYRYKDYYGNDKSALIGLLSYNFDSIKPEQLTLSKIYFSGLYGPAIVTSEEENQIYTFVTGLSKQDYQNSINYIEDISFNCYYNCKTGSCKKACDKTCKDNTLVIKELNKLNYESYTDDKAIREYCIKEPVTSLTKTLSGSISLVSLETLKKTFSGITGYSLKINEDYKVGDYYDKGIISIPNTEEEYYIDKITCLSIKKIENGNYTIEYKANITGTSKETKGKLSLRTSNNGFYINSNIIYDFDGNILENVLY